MSLHIHIDSEANPRICSPVDSSYGPTSQHPPLRSYRSSPSQTLTIVCVESTYSCSLALGLGLETRTPKRRRHLDPLIGPSLATSSIAKITDLAAAGHSLVEVLSPSWAVLTSERSIQVEQGHLLWLLACDIPRSSQARGFLLESPGIWSSLRSIPT